MCRPCLTIASAFSSAFATALAAAAAALVLGCAAPPAVTALPQPLPPPVLADGLFGTPPAMPSPAQVLALDEPMRAYLQQRLYSALRQNAGSPARALLDALYAKNELRLEYDAAVTRHASQAFADRRGNCLSLVLMTAAFARELDIEVQFNEALLSEPWVPAGDLVLRTGHVNLTLLTPTRSVPGSYQMATALLVDFLPGQDLQRLHTVPISTARVLAMYYNNRAAELLAGGHTAAAYWMARAAVGQDGAFGPALNTLGVVYQRAGHLALAAQTFEQVLARQHLDSGALVNLVQVRQAQGQPQQAMRLLEQALAAGPDLADQARYAGKLARLRAQGPALP